MALSSVRIFLKDGLFLGSYCQQLFIIRATSEGQWCGGGIRYPKKQKTGIMSFSERMLTPRLVPAFPRWYLQLPVLWAALVWVLYLSPPHLASAGWSCSYKAPFPSKRSPTAVRQSSRHHFLWYNDLKTSAEGSKHTDKDVGDSFLLKKMSCWQRD